MRPIALFVLLGVGSLPAAAHAADALALPTSTQAAIPVQDDAGFDWSGFYAGIYGVGQSSPVGGLQYGLGLDVGATAAFDFFLVGGEVAFHGLTGGAGATSYVQAVGSGGVLLADNLAAYGAVGYGLDLGAPVESDMLVGGGVQLAVTDSVSLRAQYLHGFPLSGANPKDEFTIGANYHF
jgi:outer membrane immunogenic protein